MARISYLPLPADLGLEEVEECPVFRSGVGSAATMFTNLRYFTNDHLVVEGTRIARLQVDTAEGALRHLQPYAGAVIDWSP